MPNCMTHYLHAKRVFERLGAKEDVLDNAYIWAAQGPDIFFSHRYLPWMKGKSLRAYGSRFHKATPSVVLQAFRNCAKRQQNALTRSYALGFVNHYVLDSICHPYVHAMAAKLLETRPSENQTAMHAEVESALDTILLRREAGKLPSEVKLQSCFPKDAAVQRQIAEIYVDVIMEVFGETVPAEEIVGATKDTRLVFSLLTDSTTLKRRIFNRLEAGRPHYITGHILPLVEDAEIDYANSQGAVWKANGEDCSQSFFDLFERAVDMAASMIQDYDTCDFAQTTGERPFG